MQLYHGAHTKFALHVGQCFTASEASAEAYTQHAGELAAVVLDTRGLTVMQVDNYDHEDDVAPGDFGYDGAADVLVYEDEDETGSRHTTWRLVSQRAVDAVTVVSVSTRCDCCGEWTAERDEYDQCAECAQDNA